MSTNATQDGTRITTEDGTQIYFKNWGEGQPVVFSHGWPLNADAWENQMVFLGQKGYRAIAHDRVEDSRLSERTRTGRDP
jgi:non-heme chloroperoxidase